MSDVKRYIEERKKVDQEFAEGFDEGYRLFKIGALLRLEREKAGLTQEQVAERLQTKKSVISRLENHAEDVRLSTLQKYAAALGKKITITFA